MNIQGLTIASTGNGWIVVDHKANRSAETASQDFAYEIADALVLRRSLQKLLPSTIVMDRP